MPKKNVSEEAAVANGDADGTALFPLPETELGKAAQAFVEVTAAIADLKNKRDTAEEKVLVEMKKEGRETLTVTVGNDNWFFEIKHEEDKLRCVKQTRQPLPKAEEE